MSKGKFFVFEGVSGCGKTTLIKNVAEYFALLGMPFVVNAEPTSTNVFGKTIRIVIDGREPTDELISDLARLTGVFIKSVEKRAVVDSPVSPADLKKIRQFFRYVQFAVSKLQSGERPTPREFQALYVVDRYFDLCDFIVPRMNVKEWVMNDRFLLSTFAYGGAYGVDANEIFDWHRVILCGGWYLPDATFYIKVSAETAAKRLFGSGKTIDVWEKQEKLQPLIDHYELAIALFRKKHRQIGKPDAFHVIDGEQSEEKVFAQVKKIILD